MTGLGECWADENRTACLVHKVFTDVDAVFFGRVLDKGSVR